MKVVFYKGFHHTMLYSEFIHSPGSLEKSRKNRLCLAVSGKVVEFLENPLTCTIHRSLATQNDAA